MLLSGQRGQCANTIDARGLGSGLLVELRGGRQPGLSLAGAEAGAAPDAADGEAPLTPAAEMQPPRPHAPTDEEVAAHEAFVATLTDPVWTRDTEAKE